jgi:hypothetical protein
MTPFRDRVLIVAIALALLLPLATVASADPGDPGGTTFSSSTTIPTDASPGRGRSTSTASSTDPGDPGGTTAY